MDLSDITALGVAWIGAAVSLGGVYLNRASLKDGRRIRSEDQKEALANKLNDGFMALHKVVLDRPEDPAAGSDTSAALERRLSEALIQTHSSVQLVPDRETRSRLSDVLTVVDASDNTFVPVSSWAMRQALQHAVECVGAWRNGQPLPVPNQGCGDAERALWHQWDFDGTSHRELFRSEPANQPWWRRLVHRGGQRELAPGRRRPAVPRRREARRSGPSRPPHSRTQDSPDLRDGPGLGG
ncbi:hypothetical protein FNV62_06585 [Streptomyces sp. RLB3-17]|uniref:hypothetical protein n=1 Tax=Streptomyces sp. RLB3-17 TaxID=2594455 RepID=UPI0011642EB6|nr:hypothetical protein [Streptomyces sp. RLB3-17]QDO37885.1 hypothetical protein FNV62_06585 [Streptomyces sp. RLB3-17]